MTAKVASELDESRFILGQNSHGEWLVRHLHGKIEGIFSNRKDAIRFALYGTSTRNPCVITTSRVLEMKALQ